MTLNSKARSTKTRIETYQEAVMEILLSCIRKQDPLKQGLKLSTETLCAGRDDLFESKIH